MLPKFYGNFVRGALGWKLGEIFCKQNSVICEKGAECDFVADCVYSSCFKTMFAGDNSSGSVPPPFSIEPMSDNFFTVTLFGSACARCGEYMSALSEINKLGNIEIEVIEVSEIYRRDWNYGTTRGITDIELEFITPTHITIDGKLAEELPFPLFIDNLLSRISHILDIYGEEPFFLEYGIVTRKPYINTKNNLKIVSVKQQGFVKSGVVGKVYFHGELDKYMPYIDLGTQIHVGKLAASGFGVYNLKIF